MTTRSIVELSHRIVDAVLRTGQVAVDATAGGGRDTLFLAEQVGPHGTVYAFDIQQEALDTAGALLTGSGVDCTMHWIHAGHESIENHVHPMHRERMGTLMFNLGYLPGGDQRIVTRKATTIPALESSLRLLGKDGVMSVAAYRGHPGGAEEANAVYQWAEHLPENASYLCDPGSVAKTQPGPWLFVITGSRPITADMARNFSSIPEFKSNFRELGAPGR